MDIYIYICTHIHIYIYIERGIDIDTAPFSTPRPSSRTFERQGSLQTVADVQQTSADKFSKDKRVWKLAKRFERFRVCKRSCLSRLLRRFSKLQQTSYIHTHTCVYIYIYMYTYIHMYAYMCNV